jgi:hypothetical protein
MSPLCEQLPVVPVGTLHHAVKSPGGIEYSNRRSARAAGAVSRATAAVPLAIRSLMSIPIPNVNPSAATTATLWQLVNKFLVLTRFR